MNKQFIFMSEEKFLAPCKTVECGHIVTLMRAGELCRTGGGWRPGCVMAGEATDVMPWGRTSGVERGNEGPRCET